MHAAAERLKGIPTEQSDSARPQSRIAAAGKLRFIFRMLIHFGQPEFPVQTDGFKQRAGNTRAAALTVYRMITEWSGEVINIRVFQQFMHFKVSAYCGPDADRKEVAVERTGQDIPFPAFLDNGCKMDDRIRSGTLQGLQRVDHRLRMLRIAENAAVSFDPPLRFRNGCVIQSTGRIIPGFL